MLKSKKNSKKISKRNRQLKIKIISKKGERSITIKRFPVFIGSGSAPNIIRIPDRTLPAKYGGFFEKDGKIYYKDNSELGTRINSALVKNKTVELKSGASVFQIGRYKVLVENDSTIDETITEYGSKKRTVKNIVFALLLLILLGGGGWFAYQYFAGVPEVEITKLKFELSNKNVKQEYLDNFNAINVEDDSIRVIPSFNDEDVKLDTSSQIYMAFNDNGKVKEIKFKKGSNVFSGKEFYDYYKNLKNPKKVKIKFFVKSPEFIVKDTLRNKFLTLFQTKFLEKQGIKLKIDVEKMLATFEILKKPIGFETNIKYGDGKAEKGLLGSSFENPYEKEGIYRPEITFVNKKKNEKIKFSGEETEIIIKLK